MTDQTRPNISLTEKQMKDLDLFEALKPYIGRCLTLNHDLNNPLAGIMGYTEFLIEESDQLSEEHRGFVNQINTCAERMHKVLNSLSEEKMALTTKTDLRSVVAAYESPDKPSD